MDNPDSLLYTEPMSNEIAKLGSRLWRHAQKENTKVVAVTSALRGEGKSTTVAHLAAVMSAHPARKILTIDMDFRGPSLRKFHNTQVEHGLAEVLRGDSQIAGAIIHRVPGPDLLMPSGPEEDLEFLLNTPRLTDMFRALRKSYDLILVDTPALIPVADATAIIPLCDAVILVVMAGSTTKHHLRKARDLCLGLGVRILGLVVGNIQEAAPEYLDTNYYSYSSPRSRESRSKPSGKI